MKIKASMKKKIKNRNRKVGKDKDIIERKSEKAISKKALSQQATEYLESNTPGAVATKVILATLAVGGIVCAGAVAPGIFKMVDGCARYGRSGKSIKRKSCSTAISKYKRDGLILLAKQKDGTVKVLLSEKGKRYVYNFTYRPTIKKPRIWDRKWRVVVFDIVVNKKRERELFRKEIKSMGFKQIQKSVWVHPYKCEDEVLFLAKQLRIEKSIEILTVQNMLHREKWRKLFQPE
jgi:CRISPR-associated endonuclease Cas2